MQKVKFIPGFPEGPSNYKTLSKHLNVLKIDWNKPKLNLKKPEILVTFSFGGILALEYALRNKVGTLVLCSLTPAIEDLGKVKAAKIIFMVGEKEKWCLKNIRRVSKTLKHDKSIIVVPGANHKIVGNYRKKLLEVVDNLIG